MTRKAGKLETWAPLMVVLAAVSGAIAVTIGIGLGAGMAAAATTTDATIEATPFEVGVDRNEGAFARCPGEKRALGGGVLQIGHPDELWVKASGPLDATGFTSQTRDGDIARQWHAFVYNSTDGPPRDLKVFAICSATSDATVEATPFTVGAGEIGEEVATCPGQKRAVGGGVLQSRPGLPMYRVVQTSGPLDESGTVSGTIDGDIPRRWYASVRNLDGVSREFKVFAVCSAASQAIIEATPFRIGREQSEAAVAKCPGRKRALGGGVVHSDSDAHLYMRASGPRDATGLTSETRDGDIPRQWYASVLNYMVEPREGLKVFAICE